MFENRKALQNDGAFFLNFNYEWGTFCYLKQLSKISQIDTLLRQSIFIGKNILGIAFRNYIINANMENWNMRINLSGKSGVYTNLNAGGLSNP